GVNVVIPTLAAKMLDMTVGDAVYTPGSGNGKPPYCWNTSTNTEDTSYEVGLTTPVLATTASPTSLQISFPNPGPVDTSGNTICQLENNSGHPIGAIFSNNTVLTPTGETVNSPGTWKQSINNQFVSNILTAPGPGSSPPQLLTPGFGF